MKKEDVPIIIKITHNYARRITTRKRNRHKKLMRNLQQNRSGLDEMLEKEQSTYEDRMYRFYHHSVKTYDIQESTIEIAKLLRKLDPKRKKEFSEFYQQVIDNGAGNEFEIEHNENWVEKAGPIVQAYLHSKYFLEMAAKYSHEFKGKRKPPTDLPSGWAALLRLYKIR